MGGGGGGGGGGGKDQWWRRVIHQLFSHCGRSRAYSQLSLRRTPSGTALTYKGVGLIESRSK